MCARSTQDVCGGSLVHAIGQVRPKVVHETREDSGTVVEVDAVVGCGKRVRGWRWREMTS